MGDVKRISVCELMRNTKLYQEARTLLAESSKIQARLKDIDRKLNDTLVRDADDDVIVHLAKLDHEGREYQISF